MRISDWSSDVCSSDLRLDQILAEPGRRRQRLRDRRIDGIGRQRGGEIEEIAVQIDIVLVDAEHVREAERVDGVDEQHRHPLGQGLRAVEVQPMDLRGRPVEPFGAMRSEEHTSELQSLMRISYAVFCLKKNK